MKNTELGTIKFPSKPKQDKESKRPKKVLYIRLDHDKAQIKAQCPNSSGNELQRRAKEIFDELPQLEQKIWKDEREEMLQQWKMDMQQFRLNAGIRQRKFDLRMKAWKEECDKKRQTVVEKLQMRK